MLTNYCISNNKSSSAGISLQFGNGPNFDFNSIDEFFDNNGLLYEPYDYFTSPEMDQKWTGNGPNYFPLQPSYQKTNSKLKKKKIKKTPEATAKRNASIIGHDYR